MTKEILFIDDEPFFASRYVEELEKRYTVHFRDSAEAGLKAFDEHEAVGCVVLDIMMPPPEGVTLASTGDGLDTGLWVLETLKDKLIERRAPVIILTNRMASHVEETINGLGFPDGFIEVRSKIETPRFYLPHAIGRLLDKWA
jgi:CheY-like chemotaxis protein